MQTDSLSSQLPPWLSLGRELGSGTFSTVWDAHDARRPGVPLALKIGFGRCERDRAKLEAWVCHRVGGAHVPAVFEVLELGSDTTCLVMERLDGYTLDALLARGPLSAPEAIDIMAQLLLAVSGVHAVGMLHRDIKPANVMVSVDAADRARVRLIDLGIACPMWRAVRGAGDGLVVGTPAYMAPEQLRGEPLDARCDLYACGAILFEMLGGHPPYEGDSVATLVDRVLREPLVPLPRSVGQPSLHAAEVAMRALAKNRLDRYPTAVAMRADLLAHVRVDQCPPRLGAAARHARARAPTLLTLQPGLRTQPIPLTVRKRSLWARAFGTKQALGA